MRARSRIRTDVARLGVVDEIFLRRHRGFGTPIALQGIWRTAGPLSRAVLDEVHARLGVGSLAVQVREPWLPGARPAYVHARRSLPLRYPAVELSPNDIVPWADTQAVDLDPRRGPAWRITAAKVTDGTVVVSLVCSHAIADADALIAAVDAALTRSAAPPPQANSDLADAGRQWATVIVGVARALPKIVRGAHTETVRTEPARAPASTTPPTAALLICNATEFDEVAANCGATTNSLFISLVASIRRVATRSTSPIAVSAPIRLGPGLRGNRLGMASLRVDVDDSPATIRRTSAGAFEAAARPPHPMPPELLGLLPDRWAANLTAGAGEAEVLCSNVGDLPASFSSFAGIPTRSVAARAIHPALTSHHLQNMRTRLAAYLCRSGDDYTLALVSTDAARVPSSPALVTLAIEAARHHGLALHFW